MKQNIVDAIFENVKKFGEREALNYKKNLNGNKISYSWSEFEKLTKDLAGSLLKYGVNKQENVAVFSQNMPQWTIADLAIISISAVSVTIYATNTADQAEYILNEAEVKVIFTGNIEQYKKALELYSRKNSKLEKIIVFDEDIEINHKNAIHFKDFISVTDHNELDKISKEIKEDDLATIIYTSGTTGEPKGVMLTHGNLFQAFRSHDIRLDNDHTDHSLAFLPLSHVFERLWTTYALYKGMKITYLPNPKDVIEVLGKVKPTVMCSVPRLYQKVYQTVLSKIEEGSNIKRELFYWALEIGKNINNLKNAEQKASFSQKVKFKIADKLVLKKIRNIFGGKMNLMPCGGAALSAEITEFLHATRLPVVIGYGLTETTATLTLFPKNNIIYGSAGKTLPEVEVKLGKNNEILAKGKTIMKGYYKKPEETKKVFEGEWFKTGDAGEIDQNGNLVITDRIKDLMKTAGGKYIAPQLIEGIITNDKFIEQAVIIAEDKPFTTALVVPNFEELKKHAINLNLKFNNCSELIKLTKVKEFYENKLEQLQLSLANFEKIKKFKLLDKEFSMDLNELTPTLKIKRNVIIKKFLHLIEDMYKPAVS